MLKHISQKNLEKEMQTLLSIFTSIDKNQSIVFNSGAGAGKTYALIESIRYIIRTYEKNIRQYNQKIICITYTNVASEEIKERLGNTDLVLVSTIHERIWDLIKSYQKELVEIHKEKLKNSINGLQLDLDKYDKFKVLSKEKKKKFINLMLEHKELFYQNLSTKAVEFRKIFQNILSDFSELLSNISEFRKLVNILLNINKYSECYENISRSKKGYTSVIYNSTTNRDQLHKMRISHDTLLEYGLQIIENYDLLKQIIIDKYPYIFIDEYQDTDDKVISIMTYLQQYAKKIEHPIFIGYFGDTVQNIYSKGIGRSLTEIHPNLLPIEKEFNRRSTKEIIDIINKIRNDEIKQVSIYEDCIGGSVKFYTGSQSDIDKFVKKYEYQWGITPKNQLHCFVLTNESVAKYSGFENIYNLFKQTKRYSGINYDQLNTELLSNEPMKLGDIPSLIFKLLQFKNNINNENTPLIDIFQKKKKIYEHMTISELKELIHLFNQIEGETLEDLIKSILEKYNKESRGRYKDIIDTIIEVENVSLESFKNYFLDRLFPNILDEEIEHANETVLKLLKINLHEYESWYKYISNKIEGNIIYHTYHGTKGLEFDNVIIIMGNAFGRIADYFSYYFKNCIYPQDTMSNDKFEQIKNLLYVSCSRAIKNLRILYIDDVTEFQAGIQGIFGKIHVFNEKTIYQQQ